MSDLTIVFYTANVIPKSFAESIRAQLRKAAGDAPIIAVTHEPIGLGMEIMTDLPRSHYNIYRQALIGAKAAKTRYIAMAEDDVLYSPEHFIHRPSNGVFAYNFSVWSIYTWSDPPVFSLKNRRVLHSMMCERELFIYAMEERFRKWPEDRKIDKRLWGEPGKYERQLGVSIQKTEEFSTLVSNVVFSHEAALAYSGLGDRKRLGNIRAIEIPSWGRAEDVVKLYR